MKGMLWWTIYIYIENITKKTPKLFPTRASLFSSLIKKIQISGWCNEHNKKTNPSKFNLEN
jgi:hypothetical protein